MSITLSDNDNAILDSILNHLIPHDFLNDEKEDSLKINGIIIIITAKCICMYRNGNLSKYI